MKEQPDMNDFESVTYDQVYNNAILFLKDGIERLVNKDDDRSDYIDHDLVILTCSSFQVSLELAIRALIIERDGIRSIISTKQQNLTDDQIRTCLADNKIKTVDFDQQKNYIKSQKYIQDLSKDDFKIIDEFQRYRNQIMHFKYTFQEGDLFDLKYDLIYYMVNIILKILQSRKYEDNMPSEFLEHTLGQNLYNKLIRYRPYIEAMEMLAASTGSKVYTCIHCNNRTLSVDFEYCYCCNAHYYDYNLIKCDYCKEKSVIYDNLSIELNNNTARGLCLNCDTDGVIFQCPKCEMAHNIETNPDDGTLCNNNRCVNMS